MKEYNASSLITRLINKLPLCDKPCQHNVIYILWLVIVLMPFHEYYQHQFNFPQWDLLLITGLLTFILGLNLVVFVQIRFNRTVERLLLRGSLKIDDDDQNKFVGRLEKHAQRWARVGGIIATVAILAAFSIVLSNNFNWPRAMLGLGEAIGAYIVGNYLGRMASYGQLGWQLNRESASIEVQPNHVDGVAGLKPVGDFYFYQAMVAAIPAIFLAVWWFLFPIWPRDYSHWESPYLALLSIAIMIEILAFLIPLWAFHRIMIRAKSKWLKEADRLSIEIYELQRRKESEHPNESKEALSEVIEGKTQQYWAIENMPTWPVDIKTKRRFRLNNILLFIPLLGDIAKRNIDWKHVLELLKKLT